MAIRAIVATAAGLGLVGVGVAGLGSAGEDQTSRNASGEVVVAGEVGAFRIRLGDCLLSLSQYEGDLEKASAVPCSEPHIYEVTGAFNIPAGPEAPFPGESAMDSYAFGCISEFERYVGVSMQNSNYVVASYLYPTVESWEQLDDREILCFSSNIYGTTTVGSIRNSRR